MNDHKRGLIIGMVLGDGYIQVRQRLNNGKYPYIASTMRVLHGPKQRAYCEWKAIRLSWALGGRKINVTRVKNGPKGKYWAYQFSVDDKYFRQVHRWVYPNRKKFFSTRILNMLTPEGIAIWYLDDGSARVNITKDGWIKSVASDIATMCSEPEANTISKWFLDRFGVKFNIRRRKNSPEEKAFWLQANTTDSHEFISLIQAHVPECMKYKLKHVADLNTHERQAPQGRCTTCGRVYYAKDTKVCVLSVMEED